MSGNQTNRLVIGVPAEHSVAFVTAAALELQDSGEWVARHGLDVLAPEEGLGRPERDSALNLADFNGALGCTHETAGIATQLPGRDELPCAFEVWGEPGALRSVVQKLVSSVYVKVLSERVLDNPTALEPDRIAAGEPLVAGLTWALEHLGQIDAFMAAQEGERS